ncbi:S41 family peptidase [Planococcus faecalis]|nr:S41 family peptidase [Planococcus faecalis]
MKITRGRIMERLFTEIVHIMQHDYAGWKDKQGWDNPDYYLGNLRDLENQGRLNKAQFTELVKEYLLDFKDQHIHFASKGINEEIRKDRGFRVRRFEDQLYVTTVFQENRVSKGMAFTSIGGYTIPELKEKHSRLLNENHPERENWNLIFSLYDFGEIETEIGEKQRFSFETYAKEGYVATYSVQQLDKAILLTMTDFMNPDAIVKMIKENQSLLENADAWIIDVRVNYGGSDGSYFPFLPFIMPEEGVDLAAGDEQMHFNCTLANAERELAMIVKQRAETEDDNAQQFLSVFKREWTKNKGKGFVEFNFEDIMPETVIKGTTQPKSIVVLTDNSCGSAGESFVETCKKSRKVHVMGRPTMGLNDYANLVCKEWEEGFELLYPTSRLSRVDANEGMTGVGIPPHTHIPWTSEHVRIDVDLDKALKYLSSKT